MATLTQQLQSFATAINAVDKQQNARIAALEAGSGGSGGGSGGSIVSYSPILTSGTPVGTLVINGSSQTIYAPTPSSTGGGSTVSYSPVLTTGTLVGTLTIDGVSQSIYAPVSSDGDSVVYDAGTGLMLNGTTFSLATAGVSAGSYGPSENATPASGGTFVVPQVTVDAYGRVTNAASRTIKLPAGAAYTAGTGLSISGTTISLSTSGVTAGSYGQSSNASPSFGGSFSVPYVTVDGYGRITGAKTTTITLPAAPSAPSIDTSDFVDTYSNQTVGGDKTFTGTVTVGPGYGMLLRSTYNDASVSGTNIAYAIGARDFDTSGIPGKWAGYQAYANATSRRAVITTYKPQSSSEARLVLEVANSTLNVHIDSAATDLTAGTFRANGINNAEFAMTLGTASCRWGQLYTTAAPNTSSDERIKTQIAAMPDAVLDAWGMVDFVQYKMVKSIAEQGAGARLHTGLVAQDVQRKFSARGLDAAAYGLFCYDKWDKIEPQYNENGELVNDPQEAGDQYSIRYAEALCLEAAYQRRRVARLEERVAALEAKIGG